MHGLWKVRWHPEHLGLPFRVSEATMRSFAHTPEGHVPQPGEALSPEEFWHMVSLILERGTTPTCPAQLVMFPAVACIRCNHFARTGLHEITKDMIYAFCSRGKSRRQGNRAPNSWVVPRPTFLGSSPFQFLLDVYQQSFLVAAHTFRHRHFGADSGGPVRCCIVHECGSFVKCSLISEGPWTHRRNTPPTP